MQVKINEINEVIEPEGLGIVLDKLIEKGNKILIVGPPTSEKTTRLTEWIKKEETRYYIHAHKSGSKYSDQNNIDDINEIKQGLKSESIVIIDDIYRALARMQDPNVLNQFFREVEEKRCKIILVTTVYRWNWLLRECRNVSQDKKIEKSNVLRENKDLANYFIEFNEKCTTILVGYDEEGFIRRLEKEKGKKYRHSLDKFKKYICHPLEFDDDFKEKNANLQKIEKKLKKCGKKVSLFPSIYVIDKISGISQGLQDIRIAEKTMIVGEIIGDILKGITENTIKNIISIGKGISELAGSLILPSVPFASALIIAGFLKQSRGEDLISIVKNFEKIKNLPELLLERKEMEHDLPPLTLENIQIAFNEKNFEKICNELNKVHKMIENILSDLEKKYDDLVERIKNVERVFDEIIGKSFRCVDEIIHPLDEFKEQIKQIRNLTIPSQIDGLKDLVLPSDTQNIEKIINKLNKERKTIFVVHGEAGSGKTTFVYNLVKEINKRAIGKVLVARKCDDLYRFDILRAVSGEVVFKNYLNILHDDVNILYCIFRDGVKIKTEERVKRYGCIEELKIELIEDVFELFDAIVIETRDERFEDLEEFLSQLKKYTNGNYNIEYIEIKKTKEDISQFVKKFEMVSGKNLQKEFVNILRVSTIDGRNYNILIVLLACIWLYNGRELGKLNRYSLWDKIVEEFYGELWKLAALIALSRGIKQNDVKEFNIQNIPEHFIIDEEVVIREIYMDAIFRVLIKEFDKNKNLLEELIGSDNFIPYYKGLAENIKLTFESNKNLATDEGKGIVEALSNFIEFFFRIQSKRERVVDYPNIYVESIAEILDVICKIRERIDNMKLAKLRPPNLPEPSTINWYTFMIKSFVDENIKKVSVPLVAPDSVSFEYSHNIYNYYLPKDYIQNRENEIKKHIEWGFQSLRNEKDLKYLEQIRKKRSVDINDVREFAKRLLKWSVENYTYDKKFALKCLYLWKIIYGKIDPMDMEEYNYISSLKNMKLDTFGKVFNYKDDKDTENESSPFSYFTDFEIYIDETVKKCENLPDYFSNLTTFKDSPNIHFLKNLVEESKDDEFIIPQFYSDFYEKIKEYGQLWFTKEAYETGALKLLMTLGGAWILEDGFLYRDGREDFVMLIQHPFQEKVLAELMNLQNLKYPYEMIRNYSRWTENNKKFKFVWIRESIQPVCNVSKINKELLDRLKNDEKKRAYVDLIEKYGVKLEECCLLTQFQIHDQFVRTRTTALQILPKEEPSSVSKIIKKFTARQLVLKEILEGEDVSDILRTLKETYSDIESTKEEVEKILEFDLDDRMIKDLKNVFWLTFPEKWVRYGKDESSRAFEVLNPLFILVRELYMANLMLNIIDCYIKKFTEREMQLEVFYLLLSKYSILWFLNEYYGLFKSEDEIPQKIKNVTEKVGRNTHESEAYNKIIKEEINKLRNTIRSINTKKVLCDFGVFGKSKDEARNNLLDFVEKSKEIRNKNFWKGEIEWLFNIIESLTGKMD